ncbi:hypothetical protein GCM10017771_92710 [Streptomyces capitiformicae]|uniref:Uncharacterized protein n=1 Tax=Streptomyces capitiformicae TaxID=2014920 RepID=A0A918ZUA8_9ACTN|nr:hypothetical protein GCM10017771_92710 [Streptomyces capitiformicae]
MALGRVVDALDEAGTDAGGAASGELEQPAVISAAAIARIHLRGPVMGEG